MNLWRLEWLRMTRTSRWIAIFAVFVFFGIIGPLSARYIGEIVEQFGGGIEVSFPEPTPADGIMQYSGNVQQLGLLVLVMIAAGALTIESRYEMAVFLRTRVGSTARLLIPRYVVVAGTGVIAFVAGALLAWYETVVLIGPLDAGAMAAGMAFGSVYLLFAVAVVAFAGSALKNVLPTVIVTLTVLLLLPLIGLIPVFEEWLPSHLVGALDGLVRGGEATDFIRSLLVTLAGTLALQYGTIRLLARHEL
jgi:ABC-2 type transport system permease protein